MPSTLARSGQEPIQTGAARSPSKNRSAAAQAGSRVGSIREEPSSDSSDQAGGFGTPASPTSLEARMDRLLSMFEEQRSAQAQFQQSLEEQRSAQAQFQQSLERQFEEQKSAQEQAAARLEQRVDAKFDEFLAVHQQWRTSVDDQLAALDRADSAMQAKLELYSNVQDDQSDLVAAVKQQGEKQEKHAVERNVRVHDYCKRSHVHEARRHAHQAGAFVNDDNSNGLERTPLTPPKEDLRFEGGKLRNNEAPIQQPTDFARVEQTGAAQTAAQLTPPGYRGGRGGQLVRSPQTTSSVHRRRSRFRQVVGQHITLHANVC
jgi:hypothetical protein